MNDPIQKLEPILRVVPVNCGQIVLERLPQGRRYERVCHGEALKSDLETMRWSCILQDGDPAHEPLVGHSADGSSHVYRLNTCCSGLAGPARFP